MQNGMLHSYFVDFLRWILSRFTLKIQVLTRDG